MGSDILKCMSISKGKFLHDILKPLLNLGTSIRSICVGWEGARKNTSAVSESTFEQAETLSWASL